MQLALTKLPAAHASTRKGARMIHFVLHDTKDTVAVVVVEKDAVRERAAAMRC